MIHWRKIISFDFHHIPKLSIGFKLLSSINTYKSYIYFITLVSRSFHRTLYKVIEMLLAVLMDVTQTTLKIAQDCNSIANANDMNRIEDTMK